MKNKPIISQSPNPINESLRWICRSRGLIHPIGFGSTPEEAYQQYVERNAYLFVEGYGPGLELSPEFKAQVMAEAKASEKERERADAQAFMQRIRDEAEATQRALRILYGLRCLVLFGIVMYLYFTK